jgi:hypothetical protein
VVTTIEGIVENGNIRLREPVSLPENARVYVVVPDVPPKKTAHVRSPHIVYPQDAAKFQKQAAGGGCRRIE